MKKIALLFVLLSVALASSAQFEQGKFYVNTSLTGLNLSYNGTNDLNLGVNAEGGYFMADNLMLLGQVGLQHYQHADDVFTLGARGRYYIIQNGLYLDAGVKYLHQGDYNDVMPGLEVGYAFFLSHTVTIEPAVYYDQSLKNHSDYSTVGFKVGFGFYL
jgi:hypothetical protein